MPKTNKKTEKKSKPTGPSITSKTQFKEVDKVMESARNAGYGKECEFL